jgi:hypothetical protein
VQFGVFLVSLTVLVFSKGVWRVGSSGIEAFGCRQVYRVVELKTEHFFRPNF